MQRSNGDKRSYRSSRRRLLTALGKLVLGIIAAGTIVFCIFILIATAGDPQLDTQRLLYPAEKTRIRELLNKHGLLGQVSVVDIDPVDGSFWFERGGKRCALK